MGKFAKLRKTAQLAKKIAQTGKGIDDCLECRMHREAILNHTLKGHPHDD